MAQGGRVGFWSDFKQFFVRGLATLLPTVLTIVLLVKCFEFIQENISKHIIRGAIYVVVLSTDEYPAIDADAEFEYKKEHELLGRETTPALAVEIRRWKLERQWTRGPQSLVGFGIAVMLVYILGRLLASFLGRRLWHGFESTVQAVPGFKQIYPYVKQVTEFLFSDRKVSFSRVVAVEYPRKGIWSVGLVTGTGLRAVSESVSVDTVTIFIPSSPTPVTGYVISVPKDEVIDLPITLEEAIRFTVSGGVIVPGHQMLPGHRAETSGGEQAGSARLDQGDESDQ